MGRGGRATYNTSAQPWFHIIFPSWIVLLSFFFYSLDAFNVVNMNSAKVFFSFCNFLFFVEGGALVGLALNVILNNDLDMYRLVPTSLPYPLYFYMSSTSTILGVASVLLSIAAFYALAVNNICIFASFIFGLMVLLIGETAAIVFLAATPQALGLNIDSEKLIDSWQRNYGVPGKEYYTLSIDILQTRWHCCGVKTGKEFTTSWWLLRELGAPGLIVPLSCCLQEPPKSFTDPNPINKTACQDQNPEIYAKSRHSEGCYSYLRDWIKNQISLVLYSGAGTVLHQLILLLLSIVTALKIKKISD